MDCPICHIEIEDKVVTSCNHIFCSGCLNGWKLVRLNSKLEFTCPICRQLLHSEDSSASSGGPVLVAEQEWPVWAILEHRGRGRNVRYLVLWTDGTSTWEPMRNIVPGAEDLLRTYNLARRSRNERRNWRLRRQRRMQ